MNKTVIKVRSPEERTELMKKFCSVSGASTENAASRIVSQMIGILAWSHDDTAEQNVTSAMELLAELAPANTTEGILAVQMIGVHEAALRFLQRATLKDQTVEGTDANVLRAARLMRLFVEQVELMGRLKGKPSQQRVTVEHVHVHPGGQAIVGAVSNTRAPGDGSK